MDKRWLHSLHQSGRRYLIRPDVLFPEEGIEDYTSFVSDSEIEEILCSQIDSIPIPLRIVVRLRVEAGSCKLSGTLSTSKYLQMSLQDFARFKGISIFVDTDEIKINPAYEERVLWS